MTSPKLPIWNCQVDVTGEITVGKKFQINCSGEAVNLKSDQIAIYAKEVDQATKQASLNNLKILETINLDDHHLQAVVTSYIVGKYEQDDFFILTDGHTEIALNNLKLTVASVLQPNQKPEPYPAFPPWVLPIPIWFLLLIAALILGPLIGAWLFFKKRNQRKALIESLKKHKTARPPFDEFHRDIRLLEKKYGIEPTEPQKYILDLEKSFRFYLIRELIVPANDWSDRAVLAEVKSKHPEVWKESEKVLRRLLREFDRARKSQVSVADVRQLYLMSLEASEIIFKSVMAKNKRGPT